jgi:hypothetical protein
MDSNNNALATNPINKSGITYGFDKNYYSNIFYRRNCTSGLLVRLQKRGVINRLDKWPLQSSFCPKNQAKQDQHTKDFIIQQLTERVQVLEKIVTEPSNELNQKLNQP